ncbi:glutathione S-transferase family protein [Marinicella litoralis]|uniref:Putative glutathione S-transferase n=1 Tax=Marinicella litoralis TaxID=644220 RepID=A0A4R6XC83_9GAMM|nr:glutathione S-transferase family protein [Marinicella litoralis]TDR16862.1 putative glutathione S-transferase [Marinicella litoralis]
MGLLVDGKWHDQWYDTQSTGGQFKRDAAQFSSHVTADGGAGPSGVNGFKAEAGRYHLYVSLACPWAHRTLIFRQLKALETIIGVSTVDYLMGEDGWTFNASEAQDQDLVADHVNQHQLMHQLYTQADKNYSGRVTVPVLWDKEKQTIVSNESADIIRMFNSAFNHLTGNTADYYPVALHSEIDRINKRVYSDINNGVYQAGFATKQTAYAENVEVLFKTLDWVEDILSTNRYLVGDQITEADWRLFTSLVRFDAVYVGHFKCNLKRIVDYPNISAYLRELYQVEGVAATVNMRHIKNHYYMSHGNINPTGIVPTGPVLDFDQPHGKG